MPVMPTHAAGPQPAPVRPRRTGLGRPPVTTTARTQRLAEMWEYYVVSMPIIAMNLAYRQHTTGLRRPTDVAVLREPASSLVLS